VGKESEPCDLFFYAINAGQTREKYVTRMNKFLEIIGCDHEKNYPHENGPKYLLRMRGLRMDGW
jgi:hypothetical protein